VGVARLERSAACGMAGPMRAMEGGNGAALTSSASVNSPARWPRSKAPSVAGVGTGLAIWKPRSKAPSTAAGTELGMGSHMSRMKQLNDKDEAAKGLG
jgi:hypothetical protein